MITNYYTEIKLLNHDKSKLTTEQILSILSDHDKGYDVEFTQQKNCEGRLILKKNGKRFKKLYTVDTKGKTTALKGEDVYVSFWNSSNTQPNFRYTRKGTHAAKAIKELYEKIAAIEQYNQDILKEFNAA